MVNVCFSVVIWNIMVYNYPYNVKRESTMDTKEIKLADGKILTPVKPLLSDEQMQKASETINSPEYQNYVASQIKEQTYKNLKQNNIPDFENPVVTELKTTNSKIDELSEQLDYSNIQLKQANDKISSQNLYIKELKSDLREETEKRVVAENKLDSKDWKTALISFGFALLVLIIEHWKDILTFIQFLIHAK